MSASNAQVLRIKATNIPPRVLVQKGTIIEFYGDLPDAETALATSFSIRCGMATRASGTFKKKWSLQWDPNKEPTNVSYATLYRTESGGMEVRVARIGVQLVEEQPFKLVSPKERDTSEGPVAVEVTALGALKMAGGEVLVDGKSMRVTLNAKGTATVNIAALAPGAHMVSVRVGVDGGGDFETLPVRVLLASSIKLTRSEVGPIDLRTEKTPRVPLKVSMPEDLKAKFAEFMVDGKPFAKSETPPFEDIAFNPEGLATGPHVLTVRVVSMDGAPYLSSELPIDIIGNPQGEFAAWLEKIQKVMEASDVARAAFREADEIFAKDRSYIGELNQALKHLRAADLDLVYALQNTSVPASMAADDKTELNSALGELKAAAARLVREEESALRAIAANQPYIENKANINNVLLKVASGRDRIRQVAEKLGNAQAARAQSASALAYNMTGDRQQDFIAFYNTLDKITTEAEAAKQGYDKTHSSSASIVALNKSIAANTWVSNNVIKLAIPRALSDGHKQQLTLALQAISAAYAYRADAEKILRRRMQADLGIAGTSGGLSANIQVNEQTQNQLFNKALIGLTDAREKIKTVARALGVGN